MNGQEELKFSARQDMVGQSQRAASNAVTMPVCCCLSCTGRAVALELHARGSAPQPQQLTLLASRLQKDLLLSQALLGGRTRHVHGACHVHATLGPALEHARRAAGLADAVAPATAALCCCSTLGSLPLPVQLPGSHGLTWMSMWRRPSTAWGVRGGAEASARIALFTLQCGSTQWQQMVVPAVAAGCR